MFTVLVSFEAGSMSVRSSKRLPRHSTSMRTNAWLSFFHRMRFFPEREKQNERYFGSVEPWLSWDATDLGDRGSFCVLVVGDELTKCEKNPFRLGLPKVAVDILFPRTGELIGDATSGSGGLIGRKDHEPSPRPGEGTPAVIINCRVLVTTCWHRGQKAWSKVEKPGYDSQHASSCASGIKHLRKVETYVSFGLPSRSEIIATNYM
jgi:hypothetical protein